jgi:hypothetical protein
MLPGVNVTELAAKPKRKMTVELPKWAVERLESAARQRRLNKPENIAALLIVARLAKGSIDQDLRGLLGGVGGARTLHDLRFVQEMME